MSSRPALLLQRELHLLQKHQDSIPGIQVELVKNSLFHWRVRMEGLQSTPWEGGLFTLDLTFDAEYNEKPPIVQFMTVPFHPNIDMDSGRPCLNALESKEWYTRTPIYSLLIHIQVLLSCPTAIDNVNPPAAEMLIASPRLYNQMVLDSVVASRRVMAGLPPFEPNDNSALTDSDTDSEPQTVPSTTTQPQQHSKPTKKAIHHLSFEMYYETWKDLATSTDSNSGRGCGVGRIGRGGRSGELSTVIEANRHLIYGKNFRPVKQPTEAGHVVKEKLDRIESMKKMYNIHPSPPTTTTTTNPPVSKPTSRSNAKRISTKTPIGKLKGNTADQVETDHDSGRDTPGLYTKFTLRSGSTSAASRGVVSHSSDMEGEEDEDQWEEEADALVDWSRSLTDTTTTDPLS